MNTKLMISKMIVGTMIAGVLAAPVVASAQDWGHDRDAARHDDRSRDNLRADRARDNWRADDRYRDDRRIIDTRRRDEFVRYDDIHRDWRYDAPVVRVGGGNEWGSIGLAFGAVGLVGALEHDDTLCFIGGAGALYSYVRYEDDLHSGDRLARLRAEYFSRPYFYRDGHRFERVEVSRHGERFYQFVRR